MHGFHVDGVAGGTTALTRRVKSPMFTVSLATITDMRSAGSNAARTAGLRRGYDLVECGSCSLEAAIPGGETARTVLRVSRSASSRTGSRLVRTTRRSLSFSLRSQGGGLSPASRAHHTPFAPPVVGRPGQKKRCATSSPRTRRGEPGHHQHQGRRQRLYLPAESSVVVVSGPTR